MSDDRARELFEAMVESVGVKAFAANMDLSTRQIHRMLNGTQPEPVARAVAALQAAEPEEAEAALDYVCARMGGYFVRTIDNLDVAHVNAVKESAEAIVAISEGQSPRVEIKEIREAISALASLERRLAGETGAVS
ncbi:MAG: hypothetical protein ACYS5V_04950 [Planctomycetota bacterium]|jgi:hypothetical protein